MRITQEFSIRKGKVILEEKDLLKECQQIALTWRKPNRNDRMNELGWEAEYMFRVGKLRPRFDAFKNSVGFEHEKREQMNVRSHLLMMEAAHQQGLIDTGVFCHSCGK